MPNETHLKIGQILNHKYKVIGSLGDGGFGITYKVYDIEMKEHLGVDKFYAIKEYFPDSEALRKRNNTTVAIKAEAKEDAFKLGLEAFLREAQSLTQFEHPNIIKIEGFFKENDTAYYVMPFIEAIDLSQYIKLKKGKLSEAELKEKIIPILYGLREIHSKGIFHRDIKPENILIPKDEKKPPIIIDFGASRVTIGRESKNFQATVSEPFAPPEQYTDISKFQGSWTDIYAICMVMYQIVAGLNSDKIPSSTSRNMHINDGDKDPLEYPKTDKFSKHLIDTIMKGLVLKRKNRIQTAQELINLLVNPPQDGDKNKNKIKRLPKKKTILMGIGVLSIVAILGAYTFISKGSDNLNRVVFPSDKNYNMGKVSSALPLKDLSNIDRYKIYEEKYKKDIRRAIYLGFMMADVYFLRDLEDRKLSNSLLNIVREYKDIYSYIKSTDIDNDKKNILLSYNIGLLLEDYRLVVEGLNKKYNREDTKVLVKKELINALIEKISKAPSVPYKSKILEGLNSIKATIEASKNGTLSKEQIKELLKPLRGLYFSIFLTNEL